MGSIDRNTVIVWLITTLLAVGGGSVGTQFVERPDPYYGRQGRQVEDLVKELKARQTYLENQITSLRERQGLLKYQCDGEMRTNKESREALQELVHRVERLEWDVDKLTREASAARTGFPSFFGPKFRYASYTTPRTSERSSAASLFFRARTLIARFPTEM